MHRDEKRHLIVSAVNAHFEGIRVGDNITANCQVPDQLAENREVEGIDYSDKVLLTRISIILSEKDESGEGEG